MQAHVITIQLKNKYNVISDTKQSMQHLGISKYSLKKKIVLKIILAYLQKLLLNLTAHHIKCLKCFIMF